MTTKTKEWPVSGSELAVDEATILLGHAKAITDLLFAHVEILKCDMPELERGTFVNSLDMLLRKLDGIREAVSAMDAEQRAEEVGHE